jgi:NitT/TauT family transport system substrate-binding protein
MSNRLRLRQSKKSIRAIRQNFILIALQSEIPAIDRGLVRPSLRNGIVPGKRTTLAPRILTLLLISLLGAGCGEKAATTPAAADKPSFVVGWSVYVGWNPWQYMAKSGILKKWADKYNVAIRVQRFDYAPSLDAFVAKNIDACAMTNMEALDMPAAANIDTTSIITGDYSNGNDAILTRRDLKLNQLPGHKVLLVEKTVSQYLFERAMTLNNLESQIDKVKLVNTSDSDIATAFIGDTSQDAVVTWKPMVSQIARQQGVKTLFNSSQIPGEIMDLMVVRTDILNRPDGAGQRFAKALAGAWYETTKLMSGTGPDTDKVLTDIASGSEDALDSYKEQLSTTNLFYTPDSAAAFTTAPEFKTKMDLVRQFCFSHQLLGANTKSVDDVAIKYPDGSVQGNADRVRLRYDVSYMQMAAQGKL